MIFEKITFDFQAAKYFNRFEAQLQDLASSQCPAHLFAKHLYIYTLDPPFRPDRFHGSGYPDPSLTLPRFRECLAKAIRNLKKLRSLV